MQKSPDAYRTISEAAEDLKLPQHVLRFWETRFPQIKPMKRGGNRRFYRPEDVELLRAIRILLYDDGYTIKGVQRILREQGPRAVTALVTTVPRRPTAAAAAPLHSVQPSDRFDAFFETAERGETDSVAKAVDEPFRTPSPTTGETRIEAPKPTPSVGHQPHGPVGLAQGPIVDGLRAVLAELVECERILAAARR